MGNKAKVHKKMNEITGNERLKTLIAIHLAEEREFLNALIGCFDLAVHEEASAATSVADKPKIEIVN